jgi:hypothetical protein
VWGAGGEMDKLTIISEKANKQKSFECWNGVV